MRKVLPDCIFGGIDIRPPEVIAFRWTVVYNISYQKADLSVSQRVKTHQS